MRVLVVDDDPMARLLAEVSVRSLGHEVHSCSDGEEAWSEQQQFGARVIVSDWKMPRLDGLGLCKRVRETGGRYTYFILISSAVGTHEAQEAALSAGVDDVVVKPLLQDRLSYRLEAAQRQIEVQERAG